ncbi:hypothetical protein DFQ28_001540 [Apophysomyces sp. BC1034]|nr:hypothetical protein DFQ28_001540 [Apophysomyces sp. BC1034]
MSSLSKTTQDVGSSPSPSSSSSSSSYYPPPPSMIQSRTLPLPSRRASYSGGAQPGPYYQHPPPSLPITPLSEENDVYPFHQGIPSYHPLAPHPTAGHRVRSSWPPAYYSPVSPPPAPHPTAAAARLHLPPGATADHPLDVVAPHHHHRWPFPDVFGGHPVPPWRVSTSSSSSYADHRRSSVSTIDSGASLSSTSSSSRGDAARAEGNFRRRLSAADLQVPIEHLQAITLGDQCLHPQDKTMKKETDFGYEESKPTHPLSKWSPEDVPIKQEEEEEEEETAKNEQPGQPAEDRSDRTVDITSDEYEALQGFGKFRAQSIVNSESRDPLVGSPNIASQVYAFRQRLMPVQESFQRPMRHDAV